MKRIFTAEEMAQITYHETVINEDALHLVLSKNKKRNQELISLFNEGLRQLKLSGKYDEILQNALDGKYDAHP